MAGLIGKKIGMTRIFDEETGAAVPVTVLEAGPCPVVQVKTDETDGYRAVQLGFGAKKAHRSTLAEVGHARKAALEAAPTILREFTPVEGEEYEPGQSLTVEVFEIGDAVKVTGTSKGRGFQGAMKRHGFRGRPGGHGHPKARIVGSLGPGTDPSRVIKGKKLPGQMGNVRSTIPNVRVVKVDAERNLIFLKGGVPGSRNSYVLITK
ncbi:MAG: 50S ribosomal protein L3 [Longimicrobiales bacterium]